MTTKPDRVTVEKKKLGWFEAARLHGIGTLAWLCAGAIPAAVIVAWGLATGTGGTLSEALMFSTAFGALFVAQYLSTRRLEWMIFANDEIVRIGWDTGTDWTAHEIRLVRPMELRLSPLSWRFDLDIINAEGERVWLRQSKGAVDVQEALGPVASHLGVELPNIAGLKD